MLSILGKLYGPRMRRSRYNVTQLFQTGLISVQVLLDVGLQTLSITTLVGGGHFSGAVYFVH